MSSNCVCVCVCECEGVYTLYVHLQATHMNGVLSVLVVGDDVRGLQGDRIPTAIPHHILPTSNTQYTTLWEEEKGQ